MNDAHLLYEKSENPVCRNGNTDVHACECDIEFVRHLSFRRFFRRPVSRIHLVFYKGTYVVKNAPNVRSGSGNILTKESIQFLSKVGFKTAYKTAHSILRMFRLDRYEPVLFVYIHETRRDDVAYISQTQPA